MQITNVSKYRIPFAGNSLEPHGGTVVLDESPTGRQAEILEFNVKAGLLTVDHEPTNPVPKPIGDEDADTVPIEIPKGFAKWHTNKAKSYIRKQEDIAYLRALLTCEPREKVAEAINSRIEELNHG